MPVARTPDDLFARAVALSADERSRFLDQACDTDTSMRSELELLIRSHDQAGGFLETPPLTDAALLALPGPDDEAPLPDRIGRFQVISLLGAGGMGRVYLAQSDHPRRLVALKVIKAAAASQSALRRFEQEAQLVALLQHPGIAQVYEAGATETPLGSQPFFAMELVRGAPLTEYVRTNTLSTRERLDLFCKICDAVGHAHSQGVVHRDLKPANILVTAEGQPKILDFGVARFTDPEAPGATIHTHAGQLIGTLAYMSPEQVGAEPGAVDARSDVYTLGVLLYELLTGKLPHDVSQRSIPDAIRVIQEEQPSSLSTLDRGYRGDIDTIVSKALEKDRRRRYQSAGALAEDVRRSLRDEPIVARPPSTLYQLGKFAKRNKALVGGVVATFAALVIGLAAALTQAHAAEAAREDAVDLAAEASEARVNADRAREDAVQSARDALAAQRQAESNLELATGINAFIVRILSSPDPDEHLGRGVTILEALERSAAHLEESLPTQPQIRGSIHRTVGITYRSLAEYAKAEPHLREALALHTRSLGAEHEETIVSTLQLANLLLETDRAAEALPLLEPAFEIVRRTRPEADPVRVSAANALSDARADTGDMPEAISLRREVVRIREASLAPDHPDLLNARLQLARLLARTGKFSESIPLGRSVFEAYLASGRPATSRAVQAGVGLGNDLAEAHAVAEVQRVLEQVEPLAATIYGPDHPGMLTVRSLRGAYLGLIGNHAEAEAVFRELVQAHRGSQTPVRAGLVRALSNLGGSLQAQGRTAEAEDVFREGVAIVEAQGRAPDRFSLAMLTNLATTVRLQKRWDEALDLYAKVVATAERILPPDDWQLAVHKYGYAIVLASRRKPEPAEQQLLEAHAILLKTFPETDERIVTVRRSLVDLYTVWEKPDQAAQWREKLPPEFRK